MPNKHAPNRKVRVNATPICTDTNTTARARTFGERVKYIVQHIPPGTVMTYKEVAIAVDSPKSARAVARWLSNNYDLTVPCHRVIRSDGTIGGYNRGGATAKLALLCAEGYCF